MSFSRRVQTDRRSGGGGVLVRVSVIVVGLVVWCVVSTGLAVGRFG